MRIIENKETGQRMAKINGQWVEVESVAQNEAGDKMVKVNGKWLSSENQTKHEKSAIGRSAETVHRAATEFAHGANRTIAGTLDLPADIVNAGLSDAGIDPVVPRVREKFDEMGITQHNMEPGLARNILSAAGEVTPAALAMGQALRTTAGMLPGITAGETAGMGITRDLGRSTAGQDVSTGIASAMGGEIGQEVGGPTGRAIGSTVAPLTLGAGSSILRNRNLTRQGDKMLSEAAPSAEAHRDKYRKIFEEVDKRGEIINKSYMKRLNESIFNTLQRDGFNAKLMPKTAAALEELAKNADSNITVTQLDILRRIASNAAKEMDAMGKPTADAAMGTKMVNMIDNFINKMPDNPNVKSPELMKQARAAWRTARKTDILDTALMKADVQASGFENGMRLKFGAILANPKQRKAFTEEEIKLMMKVRKGGGLENFWRLLGKVGAGEGQRSSFLGMFLGIGAGSAIGSNLGGGYGASIGALTVPAIGQIAMKQAQRMTRRNVRLVEDLVRAGSDGRKIAQAYVRNVPKEKQSVQELTGLLLKENATIPKIKGANRLISDSAFLTSLIKQEMEEE